MPKNGQNWTVNHGLNVGLVHVVLVCNLLHNSGIILLHLTLETELTHVVYKQQDIVLVQYNDCRGNL